ncbi:MAG: aminodeoxychorismate/anthranilate synthase component II [Proteobacteria bacterium]|nr:aminodeoxychorismate/anthranilate synthase component II [Pseudomonadota bacterium]
MILLIDNFDSFTYNLYQHLSELGARVVVKRNDVATVAVIERLKPEGIVISPGPGRPEDAGSILEVLRAFVGKVPILGVCLGHQAMAQAFGGKVVRAKTLMHGKASRIRHDGRGLYRGVANPFEAARYHSLMVDRRTLPREFVVTSRSEDGTVMGIRHRKFKAEGVQFHPESVMTPDGKALLRNFLER